MADEKSKLNRTLPHYMYREMANVFGKSSQPTMNLNEQLSSSAVGNSSLAVQHSYLPLTESSGSQIAIEEGFQNPTPASFEETNQDPRGPIKKTLKHGKASAPSIHPSSVIGDVGADLPSLPSSPTHDDQSATACPVTKDIIPFHLTEESLNKRWEKYCRRWKGICSRDKILMFVFWAFLPPDLFSILLEKMIAESKRTSGMNPVISQHSGIFSLRDSFYFKLKEVQKYNQIHVFVRHKHEMNLCELYETLRKAMEEIQKEKFPFIEYAFGPPCPNPSCPGASADGSVLESDSDEEEEADTSTHGRKAVIRKPIDKRPHVVQINPQSPSTPVWCNHTPLHDFQEIIEWCEPQQAQGKFYKKKSEIKIVSVERCCIMSLIHMLGKNWKNVGRMLCLSDAIIDNIEQENPGDQVERAYKMLQKWKESFPSKQVNTGTLFNALNEMQCEALAKHCTEEH